MFSVSCEVLLDKEFHQAHLQSSWVWLFGSLGTTVSIVIFISYHPFHCFEVTSQEDKDQPHTSLARAVQKNQRYVILYPKRQAPNTIKSTLAVTVQVTTWPERMQKSAYDVHVIIYHLYNTTRPWANFSDNPHKTCRILQSCNRKLTYKHFISKR